MIDRIQIDRLVDDELGDAERRDLLRQLDATPDGWRLCALAFLEARAIGESARSWTRAMAPVATPRRRRGRSVARWATAAAILGIVFGSGYAVGHVRTPTGTSPDVASSVNAEAPLMPAPTVASVLKAWESAPAAVPDYVRSRWEREGYQIEEERKVMAMDLGDGRRVVFPVDDVRVQYVGRTTY